DKADSCGWPPRRLREQGGQSATRLLPDREFAKRKHQGESQGVFFRERAAETASHSDRALGLRRIARAEPILRPRAIWATAAHDPRRSDKTIRPAGNAAHNHGPCQWYKIIRHV